MNIHEIIFYLKSRYSTDNRNQITFIQDIPSQGDVLSFEAISEDLKTFSKSMKEDENMSLRNKVLFGGSISTAAKAYRHDKIIKKRICLIDLKIRYTECKIKKQTIDDYRNLYKLMSVAPKSLNCRVNMTYFVKNYEILLGYFEEYEEQIPWKHSIYCTCEALSLTFPKNKRIISIKIELEFEFELEF